jgi:hypothetical protein
LVASQRVVRFFDSMARCSIDISFLTFMRIVGALAG